MKMKLFGLSIGVLLLLSPGLMGQGIPSFSTAPVPPGASPSSCGSIWKVKVFEANAVWTVPAGVEVVWVTGVGGGGGGASASSTGLARGGGGGGGASSSHRAPVNVGGMTSVNIVIGLGGAAGQPGGHTKFGEFFVGRGGSAGEGKNGGANGAGFMGDSIEGGFFASGGGGGKAYDAYYPGPAPGNSSRAAGGKELRHRTTGAGGGASAFGWGGDGAVYDGGAEDGQGAGAGGGGGTYNRSTRTFNAAGRGSNGFLLIEWSEPRETPESSPGT